MIPYAMPTILRSGILPAQNKATYYRRSYIWGDLWTGSFLDSSTHDLIYLHGSLQGYLVIFKISNRGWLRWWPLRVEWHVHLRADSVVWLSHTSSVWPWSSAPKSTFVQYICKRLTSGALAVHFLDNVVPLHWQFADNEAAGQLIGLQMDDFLGSNP